MSEISGEAEDRSVPRVDSEPLGAVVETAELGDGRYVLRVRGYLDLASTTALEETLVPLSWRPGARITLDLSDVEGMDSSALALIRPAVIRLWSTNGQLEVVTRARQVRRAFSITGLDCLIPVHEHARPTAV